jgi:hypothetical protein
LAAGRKAIGSRAGVAALKKILVTVRLRLPNNGPHTGTAEYSEHRAQIRVIMPATYVRAYWAGDLAGSLLGASGLVDGKGVIRVHGEIRQMSGVALLRQRWAFANMMLVELLKTDTAVPVHVLEGVRAGRSGPELEVEVEGTRETLLFDSKTLMPVELSYDVPATDQTGRDLGGTLHWRTLVDERQDVGGIQWPRRIRRFTTFQGKETLGEEMIVESVDLSAGLSDATVLEPWH